MNKRRKIIQAAVAGTAVTAWGKPLVESVLLPAYVETSGIIATCYDCDGVEIPGGVGVPVPEEVLPIEPYPEPCGPEGCKPGPPPQPAQCSDKDHKTLICHHPKNGNNQEICVANSSVEMHIEKHGDTIGRCDNGVKIDGPFFPN